VGREGPAEVKDLRLRLGAAVILAPMEDPKIAVMKRVFEGWKARDFNALLELADPRIFAQPRLQPGEATRKYRGHDEILAFLRDGDERYEHFEAEPQSFAVGSTGLVFAEGSVSYKARDGGGMATAAYWVCDVREGKIVSWESFSDRGRALSAAGLPDA
jgi:ketosteroid isomerase-like protein